MSLMSLISLGSADVFPVVASTGNTSALRRLVFDAINLVY